MIFLSGIICGSLLTFWLVRGKLKHYEVLREENVHLHADLAAEKVTAENYRKQLEGLDGRLTECFKTASLELFKENAKDFVQLAEDTIKRYYDSEEKARGDHKEAFEKMLQPLKDNLTAFNEKINQLEVGREKNEVVFKEQVQQLNRVQTKLESELTHVFYNPNRRGAWGEMQLRRIVELTGMLEYVDFDVQVSEGNNKVRPDMVVRLPNERCVIIDAKTPQTNGSLDAVVDDEASLKVYCEKIRKIVKTLGEKEYRTYFEQSADFVVLFFPGEWIFSRALQADSGLIDYGCENNVIFATPTTLIALLKSINYGWRQNKILDEVKSIANLGNELYDRLLAIAQHFSSLRANLSGTVKSYNDLLGSFESRLLPSAKKLSAFSKKNLELCLPKPIDEILKENKPLL